MDITTKPTGISLSPVITFVFSQNITTEVLKTANKVTFKQGTTNLTYTITQGANAKTITITPDNALTLATDYTLTIAKDLTVKSEETTYKLANDTILTFTTTNVGVLNIATVQIDGTTADLTTKKTNVSITPVFTLVFSQNMTNTILASSDKVTLTQGTNNITFTITQGDNPKTITISPNAPLNKSTDYTLRVAQNLSVNSGEITYNLLEEVVLEFATVTQSIATELTALTLTIAGADVVGAIEGTTVKFILGNKSQTSATVKLINISDDATSNNIDDVLTFANGTSTLTVTAEDGTTTQAYTLKLISNLAQLTALTLTIGSTDVMGVIKGTSASFSVSDNTLTTATIKLISISDYATSKNENDLLTITAGKSNLTVTAEDGTTQTYMISLINENLKLTVVTLSIDSAEATIRIEGTSIYVSVPNKSIVTTATITSINLLTGISSTPALNEDLTFVDNGGVKTATITVSNGTDSQSYTVILKNNTNSITEFSFPADGNEGITTSIMGSVTETDATTGSISVTVPALATLRFTPIIVQNGQRISPLASVEQDFSTAQNYVVTSEYGTEKTYTVTVTRGNPIYTFILGEGGTITGESPLTVTRGIVPQIPNPTHATQRFVGWFTDVAKTIAYDTTIEANYNQTLYAKWGDKSNNATLTALTLTIGGTDVVGAIEGTTVKFIVGNKSQTTATVKLINISNYATSNAIDDVLTFANAASTLTVTAEDGTTTQAYTLKLISNLAQLTAITLTIGGTDYSATFADGVTTATIPVLVSTVATATIKTATPSPDAVVTPAQDAILSFNNKVATLTVTAEDGTTTQTYTITLVNSGLTLTALTLSIATTLKIEGTNIYVPVADKTTVSTATISSITIGTGTTSNPARTGTLTFTDNNGAKTATITVSKDGVSQPYTVTLQNNTNSITSYTFLAEGNDGIDATITGTITDTVGSKIIEFTNVPALERLTPAITHNGQSISPETGIAQTYQASLQTYVVTSEYGTKKTYIVRVTRTDPIFKFELDGGTISGDNPLTGTRGISPQIPTPVKHNHRFVRWFTNAEKTDTIINYSYNTKLYAGWMRQYSITYTLYDGTLPTGIMSPQKVDSGTIVSNLPKPNKDNHGFVGWFTDATTMTPYAGPVSADITLHAKWESQYAITYNLDGGELPAGITNPQGVNEGTTVPVSSLPTPTKGHDIFAGWFTDDTKMTQATTVSVAITLYAKWTPKVGIELILRGGTFSSPIVNPIVVNSGEIPTLPTSAPTREHKTFIGWYNPTTETTVEQLMATALTENKKYYAKWERETFSITYEKNGGVFSTEEQAKVQTEVKYNLKPKLPTPTKTGSYFLGWYKDTATTMPYNGEKMTTALTLYAKWVTITEEPTFKFTKTDNDFLTETTGVTATIDKGRKIIWFPLGNGLTANHLSNLTPTVTMLTKKMNEGDGSATDFLALQTYTLTIGGVTVDYQVQVQPTTKTELTSIVNVGLTNKGNTANLNFIDTSKIINMTNLFKNKGSFNGNISLWDVSSVTEMDSMFRNAYVFTSDLSSWDTSSVIYMQTIFNKASIFTSDLSFWDTSSVEDMSSMFNDANAFTSDLSSWDTSSVTVMAGMFINASVFTSDLSAWDVNKVISHVIMFNGADAMLEAHKPMFND